MTIHNVRGRVSPAGGLAMVARHELEIPGPIAAVFEMTRDVTSWHSYMPAVLNGTFVEEATDRDVVEIVATANREIHTWRSARQIDREAWTIEFERLDPIPPLVRMSGLWRFRETPKGTKAILSHSYGTTNEDALAFFTSATRTNAARDLIGLAEYFVQHLAEA